MEDVAGFWATQDDVKKVLKGVNELDGQSAANYLAEGQIRNKSQSCEICINWNLGRKKSGKS